MLRIRKMMKRQKGFTLVELIVVIAILGVLAMLVVPKFVNTLSNAQEKTHEANIRALKSAGTIYLADNVGETGTVTWTGKATDDYADYVDEWPTNPVNEEEGYKVTINFDDGTVSVSVE